MARANPCATKNCADSAAQAINIAATRMQGAVHRIADGPSVRRGATASSNSMQTGAKTRRGLSELDFIVAVYNRMSGERRQLFRVIRAKVRAPAFATSECAAGDQMRHGVHVAQLEILAPGRRIEEHFGGRQALASRLQRIAPADDSARLPCQPA